MLYRCYIAFLLLAVVLASYQTGLPYPVDRNKLADQELMYRMRNGKDSVGYSKITIKVNPKYILVHEEMEVSSPFVMTENMYSYLNPITFKMDSIQLTGTFNDKKFRSNTTYDGDRLKGNSNYDLAFGGKASKVDITFTTPFVERLASLFLFPPLIDFDKKVTFHYKQYDVTACKMRPITIEKTNSQLITVPAGEFNTYKVRLSGGAANQMLYISEEPVRKIVKIELEGSNWIYELL